MTASKTHNLEQESSSCMQLLNKIIDFVSPSNEMCSTTNVENAQVKRKFIEEYQKGVNKGQEGEIEKYTDLSVHKCSDEKDDSNIKYAAVYNYERFEKHKELAKRRYKSITFLDEQYNLTKQAIARRYRPQMKLNADSSRNATITDYFSEPFNDDLYKISNNSPDPTNTKNEDFNRQEKYSCLVNEIPSNPETFVIFDQG